MNTLKCVATPEESSFEEIHSALQEFYNFWFTYPSKYQSSDFMWWYTQESTKADVIIRRKYQQVYLNIKKHLNSIKSTILSSKKSTISLIIMLDQVSRHLYRNSCEAFEMDEVNATILMSLFQKHEIATCTIGEFVFLLSVLQHQEGEKALQFHKFARRLATERMLVDQSNRAIIEKCIAYLDRHTRVINEFGYYPKRKVVCGKKLTPRDKRYIDTQNINERF